MVDLLVTQPTEIPGSTDDHLNIVFVRRDLSAIEHPLALTLQEHNVRQRHYFTVKRQVDTGDRGRFELLEQCEVLMILHKLGRQQLQKPSERDRANDVVSPDRVA